MDFGINLVDIPAASAPRPTISCKKSAKYNSAFSNCIIVRPKSDGAAENCKTVTKRCSCVRLRLQLFCAAGARHATHARSHGTRTTMDRSAIVLYS
jgi:hypothetical protein